MQHLLQIALLAMLSTNAARLLAAKVGACGQASLKRW
jgi:hypothetical protein